MALKKLRNHGKILFFLGRGKKGQAAFSPIVLSAVLRGLKNQKRKDAECRLAKRVRSGGFRVEGFFNFRKGLGLNNVIDIVKQKKQCLLSFLIELKVTQSMYWKTLRY